MTTTPGYRNEAHAAEAKELGRWAKTTDFAAPLDWGQVETSLLSRPVPNRDDLEWYFPPRTRARLVPYLLVVPQVLFTSGLPLVGLGFVGAYLNDPVQPDLIETVALFVFIGSVLATFLPFLMWLSTKRRSGSGLVSTAGTAVLSCLSLALLVPADPIGTWSTIRTLAAVAAVAGLANFVFLLVVAKPGVKMTVGETLATPSLEDQWLRSQRALVLEQFKKRDLVNGWDIPNLVELPRGTWGQLESLPDGRTVRHRP